MFETEVFASDPAWLLDHLVYEQVVVPGGLHGGMAVSVALSQGDGPAVVDELQIYSPLMLDEEDPDSGAGGGGRTLQFVPGSDDLAERPFEIFTRGEGEEGWTLHAGGRLSSGRPDVEPLPPLDPEALKAELTPQDPVEFYAMRSATGIYLGPSYHTIESAWATEGESLAILALNDSVDATGMELHPLLLDGCFQVLSLARHHTVAEQGAVYMPFGWQRLWVAGPMPTRLLCHATVRTSAARNGADAASSEPPEVVTGDVRSLAIPAGGTARGIASPGRRAPQRPGWTRSVSDHGGDGGGRNPCRVNGTGSRARRHRRRRRPDRRRLVRDPRRAGPRAGPPPKNVRRTRRRYPLGFRKGDVLGSVPPSAETDRPRPLSGTAGGFGTRP